MTTISSHSAAKGIVYQMNVYKQMIMGRYQTAKAMIDAGPNRMIDAGPNSQISNDNTTVWLNK